ncbi:SprT-like domain-containing protein [Thermodesulfobacteriota bacterium]
MDESTNCTIKDHEVKTTEWLHSLLSAVLYKWFDLFNYYFFNKKLAPCVISFERTSKRTLGHFVLDRNAYGLKWNININGQYAQDPLVDTLATLLHEMTHQWQQDFGKKNRSPNYHNKQFTEKTEDLGIPSSSNGVSTNYADPFLFLLTEHDVPTKPNRFTDDGAKPEPGKSKLKKWTCGCTNVRVGVSEFKAKCLKCGNEFQLAEQRIGNFNDRLSRSYDESESSFIDPSRIFSSLN